MPFVSRSAELALAVAGILGASACLPASGVSEKSPTRETARQTVRCEPGITANPRTIREAIELLNRMPKPVSVACFLQALERPFLIQATSSAASAQPAQGARSPRVFVFKGNLVISVVAAEESAPRVEFGELIGGGISIKGELPFPVLAVLPTSAPFSGIRVGAGTSCRVCHSQEEEVIYSGVSGIPVYSSAVVPPDLSLEVPVATVVNLARNCDPAAEPDRCAILRAIVGETADVSRGTF